MDYRASRKVVPHARGDQHHPHEEHKQDAKELVELIDRTTLKIKNDHEMELLIQIVMSTFLRQSLILIKHSQNPKITLLNKQSKNSN